MSTATLRYTSATPSPASIMGRIHAAALAAPRKAAEKAAADAARIARADAALRSALEIVSTLDSEGAVRIDFKVCWADHKQRVAYDLYDSAALDLLIRTYGEDAEVWGIRADGTYCVSVF